jgi:hypothetical protein
MKHPVKHLRFPKAAVETVAKFRQVAGQMFLALCGYQAKILCLG